MLRTLTTAVGLVALALAAAPQGVVALNNGLGLTPQMGWNSWNYFHCNVTSALIRETAQALVSTGLAQVGYEYINIDDCWQVSRDSTGKIVADPEAFPEGMAALASYVHSLGLKFGLYSDAGEYTCQMRPGSLGHETMDAQTYAEWGVDYLKYDNCNNEGIDPKQRYPPMRDALNATGAEIFFSMCEWGVEDPATWAGADGNSWRTTGDIGNFWESVYSNIDQNDKWAQYAGPGGWNDPDMLEIGNGNLTQWEDETHFSLWAIAKAPLIIGCDLRSVSESTIKTLSNTEVIAVSQDPAGVQASKQFVDPSGSGFEVWGGPLAEGDRVVFVLNRGNDTNWLTFSWAQSGAGNGCWAVRDLWTHTPLGQFSQGFSSTILVPHQGQLLRITPCSARGEPINPDYELPEQKEPMVVKIDGTVALE